MHISDIDQLIRQEGFVSFRFAGSELKLDLSNRHERGYAAKLLMKIRYPQSDIDSEIFRAIVREGDRVLDAGANIGFTALELIEAGAGRVVAVEPVPDLYARLEQLDNPRIVPIQCAISAQPGRTRLLVSASHNQGSSIKPEMLEIFPGVFGPAPVSCEVDVLTIDGISATHGDMDIWKLDIEGAEIDALDGAARTLERAPPRAIIVELYEQFLPGFVERIRSTHPFGYRAFLCRETYQPVFLPIDHAADGGFENTSPMYVFARSELEVTSPGR